MGSPRTIAIIPARGGSKRIKRKNIKDFHGKPLISYSISVAIRSMIFDEVFVSTDDLEIADIAKEFGASIPFIRSEELSGDKVVTREVIADFAKREKLNSEDIVCCIYATAPLLEEQYLKVGLDGLSTAPIPDYVCAVARYSYPIQRALRINKDGLMEMIEFGNLEKFSQDFSECFHDAGQFYFALAKTWIEKKPMLMNTRGIVLPNWKVQDIDTLEDWDKAEILYEINLRLKNEIR
jgi:N-acylneuraminate cytidylyltransferase